MTGFIAIDMLAEISKTLEYENDWTQLKDGVLECRLRDQYDGAHRPRPRHRGQGGQGVRFGMVGQSVRIRNHARPRLDA